MREVVKIALQIACEFAGKEPSSSIEIAWDLGLKNRSDDDIELAILYFCQNHTKTYNIATPAEFMSYLSFDDQTGNKAIAKRIEETKQTLKEYERK